MTDNVTPTQADRDAVTEHARNKWSGEDIYTAFARHRLAAEATQAAEIERLKLINFDHELHFSAAKDEIARLRGAGLTLLRECERNGVADNVLAGLIPEEKLRDGSGMCEATKNLRRAMNEFRAALSAQPSEPEQ